MAANRLKSEWLMPHFCVHAIDTLCTQHLFLTTGGNRSQGWHWRKCPSGSPHECCARSHRQQVEPSAHLRLNSVMNLQENQPMCQACTVYALFPLTWICSQD